jgi:hypothetical protein
MWCVHEIQRLDRLIRFDAVVVRKGSLQQGGLVLSRWRAGEVVVLDRMDRMLLGLAGFGSAVSRDHPVNHVHPVLNTPRSTCPGWKGSWVSSMELTGCPRSAARHQNEKRLGAQGWPGDWKPHLFGIGTGWPPPSKCGPQNLRYDLTTKPTGEPVRSNSGEYKSSTALS